MKYHDKPECVCSLKIRHGYAKFVTFEGTSDGIRVVENFNKKHKLIDFDGDLVGLIDRF